MNRLLMGLCAAALVAGCANTSNTAESGVERMYVLYCGEGTAHGASFSVDETSRSVRLGAVRGSATFEVGARPLWP